MTTDIESLRAAVVAEARSWVNTPFHHQAALKGVGCDCGGLVRGVGEAAGVMHIDPAVWRRHANYGRTPNPRRMRRTLATFLHEIPPDQAGVADVLWLMWRKDLPMHLAIVATYGERPTMIHALSDVGHVAEHGLTQDWRDRVDSVWRYPGLMVD